MGIRRATLNDIDILVSLWREFHEVHHGDMITKDNRNAPHLKKKKNSKKIFEKFLRKKLLSEDAYIQVAVDKDIVGYSICFIENNTPIYEIERLGYFSDLYLKEEYRKKGIASKFKDNAERWMKKNNVKYASIKLYPKNKEAHDIYEHWGFFDFHLEMRKKL